MVQDLFFRRASPRDAMASPPDAPTTTAATDSAPLTIADRYEVLHLLGGGGMGRVFVALDRHLKRNVAVKVLTPQLAVHPRFAEQLLREARAAAQLHHANIATVYDVVDSDGSLCIIMELLHGETLASRLRHRPLAAAEGVRYGVEIAAALEHAHDRGIVHCDLKPGNVFITDDDRVKVVDFGLARVVSRGADETSDGIGASTALIDARPGTPGYMSPEQQLGLPLDQRTDIYSFGVVLREMFARQPHAAHASRASTAATAPDLRTDQLGTAATSQLIGIIQRATAADPASRYGSVGEIARALRELPIPVASSRGSRLYYPWVMALLAAVVGLLLLSLGRNRVAVPAAAHAAVVGVPSFASASADPSMSYLAAGLSDMVATELGATNAAVTARSSTLVADAQEALDLARELGAGALVLGRVDRAGSGLTVGVRVYSAGSGAFTRDASFTRSSDDLSGIRRALVETVRSQLSASGHALQPSRQRPADGPERLLPGTMSSFEEYAQARWFVERADVEANIDHAMTILERIVSREPAFALAHASLGEAAWRKWQATREPAWSDAAQRHAFEALRLSGQQPEIRYAVALIYQGTGRSTEALSELEEVARTRPFNDDVQRLMGRLYADAGRLEDGLKALNRAIELRPGYWGNHASLGNVAYRAGRYDLAISAFQRFTELRPDSASAHQRLGTAHHAAGNLEAALASYERALAISPNANAYSNIGTLQFDAARYAEAVKAYTEAVALEPRNPSLHRNLADALLRDGRARAAADAYTRAIGLADEALRVNPKDASTLSLKAVGLARTGRLKEADAASRAARAMRPNDSDVLFEHGVILVLLGRKDDAVEALQAAVAAGYSVKRLKSDPDLAGLAEHPGFQKLVAGQP